MKDEIKNRADIIQKDLHQVIKVGKDLGSNAEYIDFVTSYFIHRIAALEVHVEKLTK